MSWSVTQSFEGCKLFKYRQCPKYRRHLTFLSLPPLWSVFWYPTHYYSTTGLLSSLPYPTTTALHTCQGLLAYNQLTSYVHLLSGVCFDTLLIITWLLDFWVPYPNLPLHTRKGCLPTITTSSHLHLLCGMFFSSLHPTRYYLTTRFLSSLPYHARLKNEKPLLIRACQKNTSPCYVHLLSGVCDGLLVPPTASLPSLFLFCASLFLPF